MFLSPSSKGKMSLIKKMLFHERERIIKVKKGLMKAVLTLAKLFPEPAIEGENAVVFENSKLRIEVRDYILKNLTNREDLISSGMNVLIDECEHDGFYEFIHDTYITELLRRGWKPTKRGFPMYRHWEGDLADNYCQESNPSWTPHWTEWMGKHCKPMYINIKDFTMEKNAVLK